MCSQLKIFDPPFPQTCLPLFCCLFHRGGQLEKPSLSCLRRYAPRWKIRLAGEIEKNVEKKGGGGREKLTNFFLKDRGFSNPLFFGEGIFDKRGENDCFRTCFILTDCSFLSKKRTTLCFFFWYLIIISFISGEGI